MWAPFRAPTFMFLASVAVFALRPVFAYGCVLPLSEPSTGWARWTELLADGSVLVGAGIFRLPEGADALQAIGGPWTGSVFSIELLADGSALIRAENGLLLLQVHPAPQLPGTRGGEGGLARPPPHRVNRQGPRQRGPPSDLLGRATRATWNAVTCCIDGHTPPFGVAHAGGRASSMTPNSIPPTPRHRAYCGTTNTAVRDFRGLARTFAAPTRSHMTTANRTNRLSPGIKSRI